ncbi:hypothetical protein PoB_001370600 [Plakobranchus ocellatus]|uniref:Uncharacterized protein n=1 Tax=Plakobranchus ocellatus TaxID=259542 RepID=A0AAV3YIV8_9GAST|nr:hypothetical protein PoB_001370600 [Plakobranchus ocellatus]
MKVTWLTSKLVIPGDRSKTPFGCVEERRHGRTRSRLDLGMLFYRSFFSLSGLAVAVDVESAMRSARTRTIPSQVQAPPPAPWPDGEHKA